MTAVAGAVAGKEHSLAAEHPFAIAVAIARVGEIVYYLAICLDEGYVSIIPAASAYVAAQEPLAIWAPFKPDVAIAVRVVVLAIEHGAYLLVLQIDDAQGGTVFEECHFLAVRAVLWILGGDACVHDLLLLDVGGIGKLLLLLVLDLSLIYLPAAVAL